LLRLTYGQLSWAVPDISAAVQPVPLQGAETLAFTVTAPDAPGLHCAKPFWLIVAMSGSDNVQPAWDRGDVEGGWL